MLSRIEGIMCKSSIDFKVMADSYPSIHHFWVVRNHAWDNFLGFVFHIFVFYWDIDTVTRCAVFQVFELVQFLYWVTTLHLGLWKSSLYVCIIESSWELWTKMEERHSSHSFKILSFAVFFWVWKFTQQSSLTVIRKAGRLSHGFYLIHLIAPPLPGR